MAVVTLGHHQNVSRLIHFSVSSSHQVSSSSGRCDRRCTGRGKGLEVSDSFRAVSFDLTVKKGKAKITNAHISNVFTTTTTSTTTPRYPATISSVEPTTMSSNDGCLCVDQGPSKQDQLMFNETGQTHVQEQIFIEETGILGNHHNKQQF